MKNKIYFGHPVNTYNTPLEVELVRAIRDCWPLEEIENPNQPHHQEAYHHWKKQIGSGMSYYYSVVLPLIDRGVFLPFEDGMFGAGVFGEAQFLFENNKPIYEISWEATITPLVLDAEKLLSIEDTCRRVHG